MEKTMKMKSRAAFIIAIAMLGVLSTPAHAAKEKFERTKPHLNVGLSAAGVDLTGFYDMSGLGIDIAVVEVRDGSTSVVRKRPGRTTWSDITLKRGYLGATDVQNWALEALRGDVQRRDITIVILDRDGDAVRRLNLVSCFPTGWELSTNDDNLLVEEVTLTYDRIDFGD
jgi:phage tail-like protein